MSDDADTGTRGRLLVAGPLLEDPNFRRSVILMIEHNDEGALGVVLNRPSEVDVADALEDLASLTVGPSVVFVGGPVEQGAVIGLGRCRAGAGDSDLLTVVRGRTGVVDLARPVADLDPVVEGIRVFTGYAGWGAQQLESEMAAGGWFVLDAHEDDAFTDEPEDLWRRVLRRQPERKVRMYADYPDDPSVN